MKLVPASFLAFKTFNRYNFLKLKKSNCFIYIVIAKYCWVIKLGEIESDQKYFAREIRILWFKWSVKNTVGKVLLAIWETFLHGNNQNYNSYKFSYKPKTRIWFSASWWSGNEKYFCLFVYSESSSTSKPYRIQ